MSKIVACQNNECRRFKLTFYEETKFCSRCGTKTNEVQMCCKDENINDAEFCSRCGTKKEVEFVHVTQP